MLVISGYKYLTSGGDQERAASAKSTMTYAIIGIVLLSVAYLIFALIYEITGVNVLQFTWPE